MVNNTICMFAQETPLQPKSVHFSAIVPNKHVLQLCHILNKCSPSFVIKSMLMIYSVFYVRTWSLSLSQQLTIIPLCVVIVFHLWTQSFPFWTTGLNTPLNNFDHDLHLSNISLDFRFEVFYFSQLNLEWIRWMIYFIEPSFKNDFQ